jgi:GTP cyclohydrolase FolE2
LNRDTTDTLEYIDATADVQSEAARLPVDSGVTSLRVICSTGNIRMPVDLSIETSTGLHRGVHMSRLVKAANGRRPRGMEQRLEEAKKMLEAQANPKLAEDLVTDCVSRFPNVLFVSGRCFESIHAHDAVATWSARPDWMPVL